jgi:hypothetical protein
LAGAQRPRCKGDEAGEAAPLEIGGIEFDSDRKPCPDGFSHGGQHSHQEAGPVLQGSTPFVLTPVGQRAEELRDQIAMRGVQRDTGEARLADLLRREADYSDATDALRKVLHEG